MTTSGQARKPAGQHAAGTGTSANTGRPSDDGPKTAAAAPRAPGDPQELRQEIERTREQLGETVEQLAAKADVKGMAQVKAAKLSGRVKAKTGQAWDKAAGRAGSARGQLVGQAATAQKRVTAAAAPVWQATPAPVRQAVEKGTTAARQRRVPLAVSAVALIAGYLVIRWWRKR
jgi:hypothetical protein